MNSMADSNYEFNCGQRQDHMCQPLDQNELDFTILHSHLISHLSEEFACNKDVRKCAALVRVLSGVTVLPLPV